jgi:hypothetical protein
MTINTFLASNLQDTASVSIINGIEIDIGLFRILEHIGGNGEE